MRIELARYRINKAKEILKESLDSFNRKQFALSANRSYYAMLTSMRAVLALKQKDSSKHIGVISLFNQYIVKFNLFPVEYSRYVKNAKRIRENADYGDFVKITEDDAQLQFKRATIFVKEAKNTMEKIIEDN